jgi:hypothetical protein
MATALRSAVTAGLPPAVPRALGVVLARHFSQIKVSELFPKVPPYNLQASALLAPSWRARA